MQEDIRALLSLAKAGLATSDPSTFDAAELQSRNWEFITATARRHRLSSLLFEGIRGLELESSVPETVFDSLHSAYYTNLTHNLVMFDHAEALIERARMYGVPLVLLKGAAFARWLYRHPALRPMGDIDILVRKRDLGLLVSQAEILGYQKCDAADHAVSLRHEESGTYLELHTHLLSCPGYLRVDTEIMLARSRTTSLWEAPAHMLVPEDHMLHLCLHGSFQHGFRQPAINACDVYLLSQLPEFRWELFLDLASSPRLAPLVYAGLGLCHRVMPDEPIRIALESLEPAVDRRNRKRVAKLDLSQILSPSSDSVTGSPLNRLFWAPGLKDMVTMVRETLRGREEEKSTPSRFPVRRGMELVNRHLLSPRKKTFLQQVRSQ
jgi:hypothetical protein